MKNNFMRGVCFACLLLFIGCSAFPSEKNPYCVSAEFVMDEDSTEYGICGANLFFYNHSERTVKKIEVVFFLFDSDGEPAAECSSRVTFNIEKEVGPEEDLHVCLSLDSFMAYVPESMLEIDYLYVSKITYADESVWEDPYGLKAFM